MNKLIQVSKVILFVLIILLPIGWIGYLISCQEKNRIEMTQHAQEIKDLEEQIQEHKKVLDALITAQQIIICESSGIHNQWGDKNYKFPAYGIGQFQERTFNWLAGLSGKPDLNWKNPADQFELLLWAIDNGYGHLWTCYKYKSGG